MEIQVRQYNGKWKFIRQINSKNIYSKIEFQEELDWWQWDLTLRLLWDYNDYNVCDIIEIKNDEYGDMYTWIIENIKVIEYETKTLLELKLYWIFTILNDVISPWSWTWTAGQIIKQIIDNFNTKYWTLQNTKILQNYAIRYTSDSIDESWNELQVTFKNMNSLNAIKETIKNTDFYFYIWCDGVLYLKKYSSTPASKYLTFWREIIKIEKTIEKKDLVNKSIMKNDNWLTSELEDTDFINYFGLREKIIVDTSIWNQDTIDSKNADHLAKNKNPITSIKLIIKVWNNLRPWDYITTLNSKQNIKNLLIKKINKKSTQYELTFWDFNSFWKKIIDLIKNQNS